MVTASSPQQVFRSALNVTISSPWVMTTQAVHRQRNMDLIRHLKKILLKNLTHGHVWENTNTHWDRRHTHYCQKPFFPLVLFLTFNCADVPFGGDAWASHLYLSHLLLHCGRKHIQAHILYLYYEAQILNEAVYIKLITLNCRSSFSSSSLHQMFPAAVYVTSEYSSSSELIHLRFLYWDV